MVSDVWGDLVVDTSKAVWEVAAQSEADESDGLFCHRVATGKPF